MATLITKGQVVNADFSMVADVFMMDGKIKKIGTNLEVPDGTSIIDASGLLVMPGGIDAGTKLGYKDSIDNLESGSQAAVAGGTTFIMNLVETDPDNLIQGFERSLASSSAILCDYGLRVEITKFTANTEEQMITLIQKGVNSFNVSLAELSDKELLQIFSICSQLGALPVVHAENGDIIKHNQHKILNLGITGPEGHLFSRPEEVESEATNRAIVLAQTCAAPLMIANLTSKPAAKIIAKKREEGVIVIGQPIVAALVVDGKNYLKADLTEASAYMISPPLRLDPDTPTRLLQMLANDILQTTGSNTCTFNTAQRESVENFTLLPQGINGLESRMSMLWDKGVKTGIMSCNQFVAISSTNAAKIFNLYPQKGVIREGSDADVIVWNPKGTTLISSKTDRLKVDWNAFEGITFQGTPEYVFIKGQLVLDKDKLNLLHPIGEFVKTAQFSPYLFSRIKVEKYFPVHRPKVEAPEQVEKEEVKKEPPKEFHPRPPTKAGGRNLHEPTFNLFGTQVDENEQKTTGVRDFKNQKAKTSLW